MRFSVLVIVLAACAGSSDPKDDSARAVSAVKGVRTATDCGATASRYVTGNGVGLLTVGLPADSVRNRCQVLADSTSIGAEGLSVRELLVELAGDTIHAIVDSGKVWRIEIESGGLRTQDSLGVGSPLRDILRGGGATGAEGEGALYVQTSRHCGISFRLRHEIPTAAHRPQWTENDLSRIPSSATVDQLLLVGCKQ